MSMHALCFLAGGESRRFGSPKVQMTINAQPVIEYLVDRVGDLFDAVWLSVADANEQPPGVSACDRVIVDTERFAGPLVAMSKVLDEAAKTESLTYITFVAIDMPRVDLILLERNHALVAGEPHKEKPSLIGGMGKWIDGPRCGAVEPLPSVWAIASASVFFRQMLVAGKRSLMALASQPGVATFPLGTAKDRSRYTNINRVEDGAAMSKLDIRVGSCARSSEK